MKPHFEADLEGLAQLAKGKPKTFIINELVQNAWDEPITECRLTLSYNGKMAMIQITDDSLEGFYDFRHAYTIFMNTRKRENPRQRGQFNLGEKLVIAVAVYSNKTWTGHVEIKTTKGTVFFNAKGRQDRKDKTDGGSVITIVMKMTETEFDGLLYHARHLLVPSNIKFYVNDKLIQSEIPFKTFEVILPTLILKDNEMAPTSRKTTINIIKHEEGGCSFIYEMGIPIMKTDCPWHIDVQQKVLLGMDRETIRQSYLQDLYAEVINNTYQDVEEPSSLWVRTGMKDERINEKAVQTILTKRFGDKYLVKNPFDQHANEEAISHGYELVSGRDMSKEEWEQAHRYNLAPSTSDVFGYNDFADALHVTPDENMRLTASYAQKIASRILGIDITVEFIKSKATRGADYNRAIKLFRFNTGQLPKGFFDIPTGKHPTKLIIHELAHESGGHIDYEYQDMCCEIGAELKVIVSKEPQYFEVN